MTTRREQVEKAKGRAPKDDVAEPLWQIALLLAELVDGETDQEEK